MPPELTVGSSYEKKEVKRPPVDLESAIEHFEKSEFRNRLKFIKHQYVKSVGARMITVLPAYGIGGIVNNSFRKYYEEKF